MKAVFALPEWLSLVFFLFFSALAWVRPLEWTRRLKVTGLGAAGIALLLALLPLGHYGLVLQRFVPLALMPLAYWQTGLFTAPINESFQAILAAMDRRILGRLEKTRFATENLRRLDVFFEYAYLLVYPMVPSGLAVLYFAGAIERAHEFWTVVLPPAYFCYATLPFLRTLPPRSLEEPHVRNVKQTHIRGFNLIVVRLVTHNSNTFPSGHAAAAVAVALELIGVVPIVGALYLLIAISIMAGAFFGRYHYALDVVVGGAIAAINFLVVTLLTNRPL
jgi:membrane-associated phospholipid phosphatase